MKKYAISLLLPLFAACNSSQTSYTTQIEQPFDRIVEYTPAPGQFINEPKSGFRGENTYEEFCRYAERRLSTGDYVSLGGWGGYIIAAFDEPVEATGSYDLYVTGNQFADSSEPGVVWVAQDKDGQPDTWYQLRGSEWDNPKTDRSYSVTYFHPASDNINIEWEDNRGNTGSIDRMPEHEQPNYFAAWQGAQRTFTGTLLPDNIIQGDVDDNGTPVAGWILSPFAWGYADNYAATARKGTTSYFRIADAVTADGRPANLTQIRYVKIQTGVNSKAPRIGEISTEVCAIGCMRTITTSR